MDLKTKPRRGVEMLIMVGLEVDGLWNARAHCAGVKVEVTGLGSYDEAAAAAARKCYATMQALNREQWFWK